MPDISDFEYDDDEWISFDGLCAIWCYDGRCSVKHRNQKGLYANRED
jgi:hypothetical protein